MTCCDPFEDQARNTQDTNAATCTPLTVFTLSFKRACRKHAQPHSRLVFPPGVLGDSRPRTCDFRPHRRDVLGG